jgi:hypothetical protein
VADFFDKLGQLLAILGSLLADLGRIALHWSLLIVWIVWWLWGVNWQRAWPVLARGAWLPLILLMIMAALVWSRLAPDTYLDLGFMIIPTFWAQLVGVSTLVALALFCGWLQGYFGWTPPEIDLEPPVIADHGHGHHDSTRETTESVAH